MHKIHAKRTVLKKHGNIMMALMLTIVVVFTMTALCAYLLNVSNNQHQAVDETLDFANADATLNAAAQSVEYSIKQKIKDMEPEELLPGEEEAWFDINTFMTAHGDVLRELVDVVCVMDYERILVEYRPRVPHFVYDKGTFYFNCIVVSITATDGRVYNMSFYISEADAHTGDGLERQKGDYIATWISSS